MRLALFIGALLITTFVMGCAPTAAPTDRATIKFHLSHFDPGVVRVPVGVPVTLKLENNDPIEHEWIVGPPDIHEVHRHGTEAYHEGRATEVTVPPFSSKATTITFDRPGDHEYICHLPGHEEYGMKGVLRVV